MIKKVKRLFCTVKLPSIDISNFLKGNESKKECEQMVDNLNKYGVIVIKDPRVNSATNESFIDMMEGYFMKRQGEYDALNKDYNKLKDCYPQYGFQTGVTPDNQERARSHQDFIETLNIDNKPLTNIPVPHDAKWRYFWAIGERSESDRKYLPPKLVPKDILGFEEKMDNWGNNMIQAVSTVSQMCAIGMNLQQDYFTQMLYQGPHLLAPTGSNLERYDVGTIFAGFHYDFNFLTIHGKSRYPGLYVWLRNGQKKKVIVEEGSLLLQAGKQFEILTAGFITCGFHEVVYTQEVNTLMKIHRDNQRPPWRVSSTLFAHIRHDVILQPIPQFANPTSQAKYPPKTAYQLMEEELAAINLHAH